MTLGQTSTLAPDQIRGFRTISEHVAKLREFSLNPKQRVRPGIASLDHITEGPAAGEVYTILGRSFSGKSLVGTHIMAMNPLVPILFFSLEMPARQALMRLYSQYEGIDAVEVQRQVREGSMADLFNTLQDKLPKQVIVDRPGLTLGDMSVYLNHFGDYYNERPQAVIIDYLELIKGGNGEGGSATEAVAKALKDWSKDEQVAVFLLHQTNRSEKEWDPPTADSARFAGYTEADVVVGMWQPGRNPALGEVERVAEQGRIRMNVLKNRITGRTTSGLDIQLELAPSLRLLDLDAEATKRYYR